MSDFKPEYDYYSNHPLKNSYDFYANRCLNNMICSERKLDKSRNTQIVNYVLFCMSHAYEIVDYLLHKNENCLEYARNKIDGYYACKQYKNFLCIQFYESNNKLINTFVFCKEFYDYTSRNNIEIYNEQTILEAIFNMVANVTAHKVNIEVYGLNKDLTEYLKKCAYNYNPIFGNFGIILSDSFGELMTKYTISGNIHLQSEFMKNLNLRFATFELSDKTTDKCEYISDYIVVSPETCDVNIIDTVLNFNKILPYSLTENDNYFYTCFACIYHDCAIAKDISGSWYKMYSGGISKVDPSAFGRPILAFYYRLAIYQ